MISRTLRCTLALSLVALARASFAQEVAAPASPAGEPAAARSWAFVDESTVPRLGEGFVQARGTYSRYATSPTRPFASNLAAPGTMAELGVEAGLGGGFALAATVVGSDAFASAGNGSAGGVAGLRYAPQLTLEGLRVAFTASYLRELTGAQGLFGRATATYDLGAWRFGGTGVLEKVFARGRDEADVMMVVGVQRELLPSLRVGVEYVGQDLEGLVDEEEAEGGARHFMGATVSYAFLDERLAVIAGPSLGLSSGSPDVLGRASLVARF